MTNYRMKRLQNTEENKERIMLNTRQKLAEPKKKTINWTYYSTSMAVIVLCIFGGVLLWDSIENPQVINKSGSFVKQPEEQLMVVDSEVELISIDIVGTGESVIIDSRESIRVIADLLNEVSSSPQQKLGNEDELTIIYQIYIANKGYYPTGAITITSDKLIVRQSFYEISIQQYETLVEVIENRK